MDVYHGSPKDVPIGITIGEEKEVEIINFEPTELKLVTRGRDGINWRLVADLESIPFEVTEDSMTNMRVVAIFTHKADKTVRILDNLVKKNEMRSDGKSVTLVVPATEEVPMKNADGTVFDDALYNVRLVIAPIGYTGKIELAEESLNAAPKEPIVTEKLKFETFQAKISGKGRNGSMWRYVVPNDSLPFEVSEGCMKGLKVKATYTHKKTNKVLVLESVVSTNEMRADGVSTTIVVPSTAEVPTTLPDGKVFDDSEYDVKLMISPAE